MAAFNKFIGAGNLTRDPEIRYTQSGKSVTKFTIAINNPRKKDDVTYVDVVAWEKLGENVNTYLKKGSGALVEGRLVIRSYDDKDGSKRKATEIVAEEINFLGSGSQSRSNGAGKPARAASNNDSSYDELDDEIPF